MGKTYGRTTGWLATTSGPKRIRLNPGGSINKDGYRYLSVYPFDGNRDTDSRLVPQSLTRASKADAATLEKETITQEWEDFTPDA
jgi:hypothetical protein